MKKTLMILVALIMMIGGISWGQTNSFIFPVKSDEVTNILDNVVNPRSSAGGWFVTNDFGNHWNDDSGFSGTSPGGATHPYHPGMDYNRYDGEEDQGHDVPVYAIADGEVIRVAYSNGYAWAVLIEHDLSGAEDLSAYVISGTTPTTEIQNASSVTSMSMHLHDVAEGIVSGSSVSKGQLLGHISSNYDHLHFELRAGYNWQTADPVNAPAGYYASEQAITNFGNIDPESFIYDHVGVPSIIGLFEDQRELQGFKVRHQQSIDAMHHLGSPWQHTEGWTAYVHYLNCMAIQDFKDHRDQGGVSNGYYHPYTALINGTDDPSEVYLLKEAFWSKWMEDYGWMNYGYPVSEEETWLNPTDGLEYVRQRFSCRFLAWRSGIEDPIVFHNDGSLAQDASITFNDEITVKSLGDGIYHSGQFVADFDQPIRLVVGETFSGLYAIIGGVQYDIDPFTVTGDMVINVGGEGDVTNPVIVGSVNSPGESFELVVSGDYVYVASLLPGMQIVDISNPTNPIVVGSLDTDYAHGIAISGNHAYISDWNTGMQIVDISNPTNPVTVSGINMSGEAVGIAISGNYVYVACRFAGMQIFDVSNPASPIFQGLVDTDGICYDLVISGNYAYVADREAGMKVIDISTPTNPVIVGSVDTDEIAAGVAISRNYAYVADAFDGVQVVDISDPTNPVIVGSVDTDEACDVVISGNYAYVADWTSGVKVIQTNGGTTASVSANFVGDPVTGHAPLAVDFTDYSTGYPTSWAWDFGDGGTSDVQNPTHTYTTHGTYTVSLTVGNGSSTDTKTINGMIVATKYIPPEDPGVYPHETPNPFNPTAVISYKIDTPQHVRLEVFDIRGRKVTTLVDQVMGVGIHQARFDGRQHASGIYFYRLTDDSGIHTRKMTLLK